MEYRGLQHAKLRRPGRAARRARGARDRRGRAPSARASARRCSSTGATSPRPTWPAIASTALVAELEASFGPRVIGVPLDVTDAASVAAGLRRGRSHLGRRRPRRRQRRPRPRRRARRRWSSRRFRALERVNVEGTLLLLAEAARHFARQGTGGDIVLVSTKNVFAPGARFGAYSATKAAAHQLARIASLELAELDVRVNMVSPDAVFSHGDRRSGLWATVGPDRMKARGLERGRARGVLPQPQPAEGAGDGRARRQRGALLRHAADADDRGDHSGGRRAARRDAALTSCRRHAGHARQRGTRTSRSSAPIPAQIASRSRRRAPCHSSSPRPSASGTSVRRVASLR